MSGEREGAGGGELRVLPQRRKMTVDEDTGLTRRTFIRLFSLALPFSFFSLSFQ